jgi:putative SOS response-associated peptidase YedK
VQPVHAKATPVILEPDQFDTWLEAPVEEALELQRPLPNERL